MKLRKALYINNKQVPLVSEDVVLSLYSPGRAIFQVQSTTALSGLIRLEMGYTNQAENQTYFIGAIRGSEIVDSQQQRLRCREMSFALYAPLPASLRHPTFREVVQWYATRTGLRFVVPEREYAEKRAPVFYTLGNGFQGVNSLGAIFGIDDYIWQQQGDGSVFVGSWQDSRWATRPISINEKIFDQVSATGGKQSPVIPQIRPGVRLNGRYVTRVKMSGHTMETTCETLLRKLS